MILGIFLCFMIMILWLFVFLFIKYEFLYVLRLYIKISGLVYVVVFFLVFLGFFKVFIKLFKVVFMFDWKRKSRYLKIICYIYFIFDLIIKKLFCVEKYKILKVF